MSEQVRATRHQMTQEQKDEAAAATEEATAAARSPEVEATLEHSDELLDEIDAVLEENAQEFVRDYVQKGGE